MNRIRLEFLMSLFFILSSIGLNAQLPYQIVYVTPSGVGDGSMGNPSSLQDAVLTNPMACDLVLKLAIGTYNLDDPITISTDNIILEGGFNASDGWKKTSEAGATTIFRNTANPEGLPGAQRLVAIYMNNVSGFRFQDITIQTADANVSGMSVYGLHLTNCSNYQLVRCQVIAGNAADGEDGQNGILGVAGLPGSSGSPGDCDGCFWPWCNDEPAAPGGDGGVGGGGTGAGVSGTDRNGGGGGDGGNGGAEGDNDGTDGQCGGGSATLGLNCSLGGLGNGGNPGGDGQDGDSGANGAAGMNGDPGPTGSFVGAFFVPGSPAANGVSGSGGQGGRGGGGGGGQGCFFCDDGPGNAGGGGGGGGQGGTAGTGGKGAGSSYAVVLFNNGPGGLIDDCLFLAGTAGQGGAGGNGGNGGVGALGGEGAQVCCSEVGCGGNGGFGGNGGKGGNGGNGADGESNALHELSGSPLVAAEIDLDLGALPVIMAENVVVPNTSIDFSASLSQAWSFGTAADPASATGAMVSTSYGEAGLKDILYSGNQYTGFVNILGENELSILCQDTINAFTDPNECAAMLTIPQPNLSGNCSELTLVNSINNTDDASGVYLLGITPIVWTVSDGMGNSNTCEVNVKVKDGQGPILSCPSVVTIQCGETPPLSEPAIADNCDPSPQLLGFSENFSAVCGNAGALIRTWSAIDASGNSSTCDAVVIIQDTQAPTFDPPADFSVELQSGFNTAAVSPNVPQDPSVDPSITGEPGSVNDNCGSLSVAISFQDVLVGPNIETCPVLWYINRTWTFTDQCGNSTSYLQKISLTDNTNPLASWPGNATLEWVSGFNTTPVLPGTPQDSGVAPSITGTPSGFSDNSGTTVVTYSDVLVSGIFDCPQVARVERTWTVTDACNNSITHIQYINLVDNTPPQVSAPNNLTINCEADTSPAFAGNPVFTDNCDTEPSVMYMDVIATGVCISDYVITRTFTVTDDCGNQNTATQIITVVDNANPTIMCPEDIELEAPSGVLSLLVVVPQPVSSDNCGLVTLNNDYNNNDDASGLYTLGTTIVTWTANDGCGNMSQCVMTVEVIDVTGPEITCPDDIFVDGDVSLEECGAVVDYSAPVGTDSDGTASTSLAAGLGSGAIFPEGVTTEVYVVTDAAGNSASCSFDVVVAACCSGPMAVCKNIVVGIGESGTAVIDVDDIDNGSSAPCGLQAVSINLNSFDCGDTGPNAVILTITDINGESSNCTATVTAVDSEDPVITCPANITVNASSSSCSAIVIFPIATATDNCPGVEVVQSAGQASGTSFPVGTSTIEFTATDAGGIKVDCTFEINVEDNTPPTLVCPPAVTASANPGECGTNISYTAPTLTDNCFGGFSYLIAGLGNGNYFPVGTTTEVYTGVDPAGNMASCSILVTVTDDEAPSITCPENLVIPPTPGAGGAVVEYDNPVAGDNCAANITLLAGLPSGSFFPLGSSTQVFAATDPSGNVTGCSFTIEVGDLVPPVITCPLDYLIPAMPGECGAVINYPTPTVSDNLPGVSFELTEGLPSGSVFPPGLSTVTYTATDAAGNTSSCSFTVIIIDLQGPQISCPDDIELNIPGAAGAIVNYETPVGTDNCPGVFTMQTEGLGSGSFFPPGSYIESYLVTDSQNQTALCDFTVDINTGGQIIDEWKLTCEDQARMDVYGSGTVGNAVTSLEIPNPENVDSIIVEVTHKNIPAPLTCNISTNTETIVMNTIPVDNSADTESGVFRVVLKPTSSISVSTPEPLNTQSVVAYVFRSGNSIESQWSCGVFAQTRVYHNSWTKDFIVPGSDNPRNILVSFPASDINDDNRVAVFSATAGPVTASTTVEDPTLGNNLNLVTILLENVPGDVTLVTVTATSPNNNGDSFILGGVSVNIDCAAQSPCPAPQNLTADAGANSASLNWSPVPSVVGYQIKGRLLGGSGFATATSLTNSKNVNGLASCTTYEWKVRAKCQDGSISAFSELSPFSTSCPPPPKMIDEEGEARLSLFPNPANDRVNVAYNALREGDSEIQIVDILGQVVWNQPVLLTQGPNTVTIELNSFSSGVYFLRIKGNNMDDMSEKFVISH